MRLRLLCASITLLVIVVGAATLLRGQPRRTTPSLMFGLVYAETINETSTVWCFDPATGRKRSLLQTTHAPSWDGRFSLSPDQSKIAYTRTTDARGSSEALNTELRILDRSTGKDIQVADHVETLTTPRWNPTSDSVLFLAGESDSPSIFRFDLTPHTLIELVSPVDKEDLWPIGFVGSDVFYYSARSGVPHRILVLHNDSSAPEVLFAATDATGLRDLNFSPDGSQLLLLQFSLSATGDVVSTVLSIGLQTRETVTLAEAKGEIYSPLWDHTSAGVLLFAPANVQVQLKNEGSGHKVLLRSRRDQSLVAQSGSLDITLLQSGDGQYEAVRRYSPSQPDRYGVVNAQTNSTAWINARGAVQVFGWCH